VAHWPSLTFPSIYMFKLAPFTPGLLSTLPSTFVVPWAQLDALNKYKLTPLVRDATGATVPAPYTEDHLEAARALKRMQEQAERSAREAALAAEKRKVATELRKKLAESIAEKGASGAQLSPKQEAFLRKLRLQVGVHLAPKPELRAIGSPTVLTPTALPVQCGLN
jgi:hypothetical protein